MMTRRDATVAALSVMMVVNLFFALGLQTTKTGDPVNYYALGTPKSSWINLDSDGITASQALPAVGDWDYTTVAALDATKTITWNVPCEANALWFRFEGQTNNHNNVIEMLAARGHYQSDGSTDDDFFYAAQFNTTVGQQTGSNSNLYADTVSVTDAVLDFTAYDSGNDRMCIVTGDAHGIDYVTFIASTLTSNAVYIHGAWE